jgi:2,3-bisphosphoglycerate-independent phosphoglycerate mutase
MECGALFLCKKPANLVYICFVKKAFLLILDGWGLGSVPEADAIFQANTPYFDHLWASCPHSTLVTHGEAVGLPDGQMGNSEVGHINIGAGRIVWQDLARLNKAVREKELGQNPVLLEALSLAVKQGKTVHLMGLVSDGGVHSHIDHLKALCDITAQFGCPRVLIHAFTDGRDCDPQSGAGFVKELSNHIQNKPIQLASVIGRYYAMDRDKRWERVKLAYDLLVNGTGEAISDFESAIQTSYSKGITDEFLLPMKNAAIDDVAIKPGDIVICFNFRTDRCREITQVLTQFDLHEYNMHAMPLHYVTMTRYDDAFQGVQVMYDKDDVKMTLGEVIEKANRTQLRIAETEKYPHVTFFFSGGREEPFVGERRIMVPSPKVATYDLQPEMSAEGITKAVI